MYYNYKIVLKNMINENSNSSNYADLTGNLIFFENAFFSGGLCKLFIQSFSDFLIYKIKQCH